MIQQRTNPPKLPQPLAGKHLVVTRPAAQAGRLAAEIERLGGIAVLFPVLAIQPIDDPRPLRDLAARLDDFDLAVFISPNAISHALTEICAQRPWPARLPAAVMGKSSQREAARFGISKLLAPAQRHDSEALLELPELQDMAGKRVVILRGDGGRELLGETLAKRGATVEFLTCYRRTKPAGDAAALLRLWAHRQLDAITVTSSEGMRNLFDMVGKPGQDALCDTPLFAPHARIAEAARALGLRRVIATGPGDDGLLAGMIDYFASLEHDQRKHAAACGSESP